MKKTPKKPKFYIGDIVLVVDKKDVFSGKITRMTQDGKWHFVSTNFFCEYKSQWVEAKKLSLIS